MSMEAYALAILEDAENWGWEPTGRLLQGGKSGGKYKFNTAKFLSYLIRESQALGGDVLSMFWMQVGNCDERMGQNVECLRKAQISPDQASKLLLDGVDRATVSMKPLFSMAAEYVTHLGVAILNPRGSKSASGTPHSVSDIISMSTEELLKVAAEESPSLGVRRQEALKRLAYKRDGTQCVVTGRNFRVKPDKSNFFAPPILAHILPNSFYGKVDTLKLLAMFAGSRARDLFLAHGNSIQNVMNMHHDAHVYFDDLSWGIEATTNGDEVKYIFRVVFGPSTAFGFVKDGDEISFGQGPEGHKLHQGPDPLFCNTHLALARVLNMSGAAGIIKQMLEDADDSDFPHVPRLEMDVLFVHQDVLGLAKLASAWCKVQNI